MEARRGGGRERLARAGWTKATYYLAGASIILAVCVLLVAVSSNPTSQLSILCSASTGAGVLALICRLLDRRIH